MNTREYYYIKGKEDEIYLFSEGTNYKSYEFMGAHPYKKGKVEGYSFVVWAPRALEVYLIGDFNEWEPESLPMQKLSDGGLWNIVVPNVNQYDRYKYRIISPTGEVRYKADPFAFHSDTRPLNDSKVFDIKGYKWSDKQWMNRRAKDPYNTPMSIYEVNLLSWRQKLGGIVYSYKELAKMLVQYCKKMKFTHIELMPISEYPYDPSWGYQVTGYFAPTSRFGTPKDFMYFVDYCHQNGIGVIIDWVPAHFTKDDFGLARFDGTYCFESLDQAKAENTQWGTLNFDYSKPEVLSFLISNAMYWYDYYHIDGIRIDAVAYMLYLDFDGKDLRNIYGGRENLEAVEFIKRLNSVIHKEHKNIMMIAEESTSWPKVTHPLEDGGLGFNFKWNLQLDKQILEYMKLDPINRKDHHKALTFTMMYAFSETFILPLSHDEVVHGKLSLLNKMPGSYEEKFAGLRLLYQYMFAHPGKKLLFMGGEIGQFIEWRDYTELDWHLLDFEMHQKLQNYVKDLNTFYKEEKCLFELDTSYEGFEWIDHQNSNESIIAFDRIAKNGERLVCIFNFTPVARPIYPIGVNELGDYKMLLSSDHKRYGGGTTRIKTIKAKKEPIHDRPYSIRVDLPPLSAIYLKLDTKKRNGGEKIEKQ